MNWRRILLASNLPDEELFGEEFSALTKKKIAKNSPAKIHPSEELSGE
jgi:hypothetical protein